MSGVFDQDREFGIDGQPDSDIPGGGVAASGALSLQKVPKADQEDDGSDTDIVDEEDAQ